MPKTKKKSVDARRKQEKKLIENQRADLEYREAERVKDTAARRTARENQEYRQKEQRADMEAHRIARANPLLRTPERNRDASAKRSARENQDYRQQEQAADTEAHQIARANPLFRTPERERDAVAKRGARENQQYRQQEQAADTEAHQIARANPVFRTPEKLRDAAAKKAMRSNPAKRRLENEYNARQKSKTRKMKTYDELLADYNNDVRDYPIHVCVCCGRTLYSFQIKRLKLEIIVNKFGDEFLASVYCYKQKNNESGKAIFCGTCHRNVSKGKIPRLCLSNGFEFPEAVEELKILTELEERLVSPRMPFMQIRPLTYEGQLQLRGSIVNVETDLELVSSAIPRSLDDTATVQVKFMRRQQYQRPVYHANIRPYVVHKAGEYLVQTPLFKEKNIGLSTVWNNSQPADTIPFIVSDDEVQNNEAEKLKAQGDENLEDTTNIVGAEDTLVFHHVDHGIHSGLAQKSVENFQQNIQIAPAEGNKPIPFHLDDFAEELSFPKIYCGQKRMFKPEARITYTDINKSELLRYDPRACGPTKVLYSFKRSFNEKVRSAASIYLRKKKGSEKKYTASQVRNSEFVSREIVKNDEGYAVWKNLRSSPSYWAAKCKKVVAMVRQLGRCTFFITLSAAEKKWPELLVYLKKRQTNEDITEEEAALLPIDEKNELIRNDPVSCMRMFDQRYKALKKHLLSPENGLLAPYQLTDYFNRMEFQMRGSPHMHGIYWIEGAPKYKDGDADSKQDCVEFIDKFITCERSEDEALQQYIGYQLHKHSHTCRKRVGKKKCRFGFPKPPLPCTMILDPLDRTVSEKSKIKAKKVYEAIQENLETRTRQATDNPSFEDFINELTLTQEQYVLAIRSSIKRTSVFLKRSVREIFMNPYNPQLLTAWGANIDIQFVLDTYACAKYCVGYMLKSDGGMSKLLRQINQQAAAGNEQISNKLEKFAKVLWTGTEISAQEAAGFLLGIHNTDSTRQDIYINTSLPEDRTYILKSKEELKEMKDDDEDIVAKGLLDHYKNRSEDLEDTCLADFASQFDFKKRKTKQKSSDDEEDDERANDIEEIVASEMYEQIDGSGFMKKRAKGKPKIIRFRHFSEKQEYGEFLRERLMLFVPWRDEQKELIGLSFVDKEQKYEQYKSIIDEKYSTYYYESEMTEETIRCLVDDADDMEEQEDENEMDDQERKHLEDQLYDASKALGISETSSKVQQFLAPKEIPDSEYSNLMRTLNTKQRRYVMNIISLLKTSKEPFYHFLSGGAGVGKSRVITAIVQSSLRYFGHKVNRNPNDISVVVAAFTGKAAFNVFGMTLHCAFHLPANQQVIFCDLDESVANSLRVQFAGLKLIILEEISMISLKHLKWIDERLKQIKGNKENFGGISVLAVGHLRQLAPICGQFVFERAKGQMAVQNPLWEDKFELYELDEIMRQKGDLDFCKALNNMSEGCMDEKDIFLLRSREVSNGLKPPDSAIWLFKINRQCMAHNEKVHANMSTDGILCLAKDKVEGKGSEQRKLKILEEAKNLNVQNSDGLRYSTFLKVDAQFFISTNINVADGLFNGATGTLKHIEKHSAPGPSTAQADPVVVRVWMEFENPLIGCEKRKQFYKHNRNNQAGLQIQPNWVPIEKITRKLSKLYRDGLKIVREQIPLVACNGMTIAKSQGSTIQNVVVSTHGRRLERSELYVACSRATSLSGLYIDGKFTPPDPPSQNDSVGKEMNRLRTTKALQMQLKFLQDVDDTYVKIYFHNIQSLHAHIKDLVADNCPMSSDFLAFVEPHLLHQDEINISNFDLIHRSDCSISRRTSEGAILFAKRKGSQIFKI